MEDGEEVEKSGEMGGDSSTSSPLSESAGNPCRRAGSLRLSSCGSRCCLGEDSKAPEGARLSSGGDTSTCVSPPPWPWEEEEEEEGEEGRVGRGGTTRGLGEGRRRSTEPSWTC